MIQRAPRPQGFELHSLASTHFGILGKDENNDEDDYEKERILWLVNITILL